jgi:hypothetical protein
MCDWVVPEAIVCGNAYRYIDSMCSTRSSTQVRPRSFQTEYFSGNRAVVDLQIYNEFSEIQGVDCFRPIASLAMVSHPRRKPGGTLKR